MTTTQHAIPDSSAAPHSSPTPPTAAPVLVLGATGMTGRRVALRLDALGIPVRAASRSSSTVFDWSRPGTWAPAFAGVQSAYVTYQPDLAAPGATEAITALVEVARSAGVARLVLLSGRGEPQALACEDLVMSGLPTSTVLRCSWFDQNFSEGVLSEAVRSGVIALPVDPSVREPFLDADDIADAAVVALLDPAHHGRRYELTGPEPLTFDDVAVMLTAAARRPVRFVPVTSAEFVAGAVEAGLAAEEAHMLAALFAEVLDGRNESVTDGVQQVLGRPARRFSAHAQLTAADGGWSDGEVRAS